MASGFLVLSDGRCFARRWSAHDAVLREVAKQLDGSTAARELRDWLLAQLPSPEDEEHVGYGPWFRNSDQQLVERFLDLREFTHDNQRLFHQAARRAGECAGSLESEQWPDWLRPCLEDLADMAARADNGEPPLSRSEWREVVPSQGRRIGPGWQDAEPDAAADGGAYSDSGMCSSLGPAAAELCRSAAEPLPTDKE